MDRRTAVVTGAAGGIGRAVARRLVGEGWFVGLTDLSAELLAPSVDELGRDNVVAYAHDVRDAAGWDAMLRGFGAASGGRLDALVNNAGVLSFGWFEEQSADDIARQIDVNVRGVALGARAALPMLRAATPGSVLVNIASAASLAAAPKLAVYSATKFAVRGLSEALDLEWSRFGVRVGCVCPYVVDTPMLDSVGASGQRFRDAAREGQVLTPGDVADAVWAAINDDALHYPVGDAPAALLGEIAPRLDATRADWRGRSDEASR